MTFRALLVSLSLLIPASLMAEDLDAIFNKVKEYVAQNNFPKAKEELGWATKEIDKLHSKKLESFLPNEVAGYTGGQAQVNSIMGMSNVERVYKNGQNTITATLTSTGGAASGFAAFGKMAAMMGQQAGQESFRLDGMTANLEKNGNNTEISVFLDSGDIFKLQSNQETEEKLKEIVKAFNLSGLNNYLKGAS